MDPASGLERPVSISAGCARSVLAGRKRLVRQVAADPGEPCPFGQPGDRLWLREPWALAGGEEGRYLYQAAGGPPPGSGWQPPKTMPREASRLLAEVRSVRLERLQDIPADELEDEGALWREGDRPAGETEREGFARWWDSLHSRPGTRWEDNPWVWVVRFEPL